MLRFLWEITSFEFFSNLFISHTSSLSTSVEHNLFLPVFDAFFLSSLTVLSIFLDFKIYTLFFFFFFNPLWLQSQSEIGFEMRPHWQKNKTLQSLCWVKLLITLNVNNTVVVLYCNSTVIIVTFFLLKCLQFKRMIFCPEYESIFYWEQYFPTNFPILCWTSHW